jgi:Pentapeptide repeats (8 copies)
VLGIGWLLLLLVAAGLVLGLGLGSRRGRAACRWLRRRLTARPVRWVAAAAGVMVLVVLVVVVLPPRFTAHRTFDQPSEELKAQNDVRTTLLQALAGGVLLLGAYFTYRQLRVTREGQITDRYTKAVDQLGSDHLDVRVGGIYALERIARDSPGDRATIEEVLTAYVRDHAPWPPSRSASAQPIGAQQTTTATTPETLSTSSPAGTGTARQPDENVAEPLDPAADVLAAVTVLCRRLLPPSGLRPLDLTRVHLRGALLDGANLQDAQLAEANLQRVRLIGANLQRVRLDSANLQNAWLHGANLQDAQLRAANLRDALLDGANLRDANLSGADLKGARADERTNWPGWSRAEAEARGVRYRD